MNRRLINNVFSVGLSHMIGASDVDNAGTWIHESYHYYQVLTQGWWGQLENGAYEQWFIGEASYTTPGTNEYGAYEYQKAHKATKSEQESMN